MGGLLSKSQTQASATTAAAAASEQPDDKNEQKSEVAEQTSTQTPQQAVVGNEDDVKQLQEETAKVEESAAPAAAEQSVVVAAETNEPSAPSAEPHHQPDEKEPEVVETPQVVQESPQSIEPVKADESVSEAGKEAAASEPVPETAVCGEEVQVGSEVSSPKAEARDADVGADVDTLVDDVTKLKIVPDEAPAESGNTPELVSSVTNELRPETDSTSLPTVDHGEFVEQTANVPVDNACQLIENEAA